MGRCRCCSREGLNRGAWTAQEDKILTDYVLAHGEGRWRVLPKKAGISFEWVRSQGLRKGWVNPPGCGRSSVRIPFSLYSQPLCHYCYKKPLLPLTASQHLARLGNPGLNRCGRSCRLRWLNYLRPDIKRGNISEDEEELIIRMHKLLGNRWSLIAGRLPGRTDNEIKNYWNTNLAKKLQQRHAPSSSSSPTKKRSSPGTRGKKSASKRPKSSAKARISATRPGGNMTPPPDSNPAELAAANSKAREEEEQEECGEKARQSPGNLASQEVPRPGPEDAPVDAYLDPIGSASGLKNSERERFDIVMDLDNNNEDTDFLFEKSLLEEYLVGDAYNIPPGLDSDMESLRGFLDSENIGWI